MYKTVIVSSPAGTLARHLRTCGYRVVDFDDGLRPGSHATAIITTGHNPDNSRNPWAEHPADINLGGHRLFSSDCPIIQATGLQPEQVIERLRQPPSGNLF